jgi:hypothetical protein
MLFYPFIRFNFQFNQLASEPNQSLSIMSQFTLTNVIIFQGRYGSEVTIGQIDGTSNIYISRNSFDPHGDEPITIKHIIVENALMRAKQFQRLHRSRREAYIAFIQELLGENAANFEKYIPYVAGIKAFSCQLPANTHVFMWKDHPSPYVVVSCMGDEYMMRSARHPESMCNSMPERVVRAAAFASWQGDKRKVSFATPTAKSSRPVRRTASKRS